jgi:hypothetical protein
MNSKKYIIKAIKNIYCYYETEIKAKNQDDAYEIAQKTPLSEWDIEEKDTDGLSIDEIEEVKNEQ